MLQAGVAKGIRMRIPFSKPYRAFPELDPFSDCQCETMIAMARHTRAVSVKIRPWVFAHRLSPFAGNLAYFLVLALIFPLIEYTFGDSNALARLAYGLFIVLVCGGLLRVLFVRDAWLRRLIQDVLESGGSCTRCQYSLLGLPEVHDGCVRCPECGHVNMSVPALRALVGSEGARA